MDEAPSDESTGPRPRSLAGLLRWSITCYRAHPELLGPFAVVAAFGVVLEVSVELLEELSDVERGPTVRVDADVYDAVLSEYVPDALVSILEELLWLFALGVVGNAVATALVALLAFGIAALVAADATADRTRTQLERASVVADRLPTLFVAGLGAGLLVGIGLALFVVPGLYLAVKLALAGPAIAVDDTGVIDGFRSGWAASEGRFLEVGGVVGCVALIAVLAGLVPIVGVLLVALGVLPPASLAVSRLYVEGRGFERESIGAREASEPDADRPRV